METGRTSTEPNRVTDHRSIKGLAMTNRIRLFVLVECLAFTAAALVHFGVLIDGYEHSRARIAESIIAFALFAGLVTSILRPAMTKDAGIVSQAFALLGTLVGLFTIAIGVG